ncbi:Ubiquitin-associated protein 1 [Mactra antiquata]
MAFGGGNFTTNCLDDIPFKLGPKFIPPTKVVLPPEFQHSYQSKCLNAEYTFEVEEAVLKWSAEKERQRLESEAAKLRQPMPESPEDSDDETGQEEPIYENTNSGNGAPVYENPSMLIPQPAPRPAVRRKPKEDYVNMTLPNPLIANISNDILQPTVTYSSDESDEKSNATGQKQTTSNIDLTWFEKEDDPFNNLELQTINVMDELASVLEETKKSSPVPNNSSQNMSDKSEGIDESKIPSHTMGNLVNISDEQEKNDDEARSESPEYENIVIKMMDLKVRANGGPVNPANNAGLSDLSDLPPVPPRRDLVGNGQPLPPIGHSTSEPSFSGSSNMNIVNASASSDSISDQNSKNQSGMNRLSQTEEGSKLSGRRMPLPKPPRTFTYSRHELDESINADEDIASIHVNVSEPNYNNTSQVNIGNNLHVQFTNSDNSCSDQSVRHSSEDLTFVQHHFGSELSSNSPGVKDNGRPHPVPRKPPAPPPRPSSQQSWNRYSPLPPAGSGSKSNQSSSEYNISPSPREDKNIDLYNQLSLEAQSSVEKLVTMGFPKDRVVRAVDKLGRDEKEVVEYLCLVDQLIEKGYSVCLAETALLMFRNSIHQACAYLELFTQMQELGFNGEKIKEALVNTNNDREKTLDILTASS